MCGEDEYGCGRIPDGCRSEEEQCGKCKWYGNGCRHGKGPKNPSADTQRSVGSVEITKSLQKDEFGVSNEEYVEMIRGRLLTLEQIAFLEDSLAAMRRIHEQPETEGEVMNVKDIEMLAGGS